MTRRLLYVDDEPDLRSLVHLHLSLEGYEVETAADGDAALDSSGISSSMSYFSMCTCRG